MCFHYIGTMETFGNEIKQKLSNKYCCTICDYYTGRKSNMNSHINSAKHIKEMNGNDIKQKLSNIFCCEICNKVYQTKPGLWKHNNELQINREREKLVNLKRKTPLQKSRRKKEKKIRFRLG